MTALPPRILTPAEKLAWLRLIRSENVGPVTFRQLLARFGTAGAALQALPDLARRGGRPGGLSIYPAGPAEAELATLERLGAVALALVEPDYPRRLAAIEDAPPLLLVRGAPRLLQRRAVALVGARNASGNGRRFAEDLARELAGEGLVIVSGLARGIDAAAHRGALDRGAPGATVAVVAGGPDIAYPPENAALMQEIAEAGAVISEMPPGTVPQARHFPRRNRLISGLSEGVVVVEAAPRSGSLITARMAAEQGRDVMAVPGSPLDPRAQGCNLLIRDGATLIQSAADVLEVLGSPSVPRFAEPAPADFEAETPDEKLLVETRRRVEELLSPSPVAVDEVVRRCQLSPALVQIALLELELAGRLERYAGNRVSLIARAAASSSSKAAEA